MNNSTEIQFPAFIFDEMSNELNVAIINKNGQIIQKGFFETGIKRGIQIYIYSNDHLPIHFHVRSAQRYLNAKFRLEPLEYIENNSVVRIEQDINYILHYFRKNPHYLEQIKNKFIELNPNLEYKLT